MRAATSAVEEGQRAVLTSRFGFPAQLSNPASRSSVTIQLQNQLQIHEFSHMCARQNSYGTGMAVQIG